MRTKLAFLLLIFCFIHCAQATPQFRFNNVRCRSHHKQTEIARCYIRPVRRDLQELFIRVVLKDLPITNASLTLRMERKTNRYSPYNVVVPDIKVDCCEFLAKRNNPILSVIYQSLVKYTNLNHTCPFDHDLIVEKLRLESTLLKWLPFPGGDYLFKTFWYMKNVLRADLEFFFSYVED